MLTKILAAASVAIALAAITAGYSQQSALVLREERQNTYWPRRGTQLSGTYSDESSGGGAWVPLSNRSSYGEFRGGGPSAGK